MATFNIEIDLANAAFGEDAYEQADELARILHDLASKLGSDTTMGPGSVIALRDVNGNRVGGAYIEGD